MAKSLKTILEIYAPRSADEKRFIDKHVIVKHPDRNGNGDEVFKASNIKTHKRAPNHGYDVGKDVAVYEEVAKTHTYAFDVPEDHHSEFMEKAREHGLEAKTHEHNSPDGDWPIVHLSHTNPKKIHSFMKKHYDTGATADEIDDIHKLS